MHIQVINFNLEGITRATMKLFVMNLLELFLNYRGSFQNTGLLMRRTIRMEAFTSGKHEMPIKRF
jgi:hypothetical protein